MKITNTKFNEIKIIEPLVYDDNRGYFFESFNRSRFEAEIKRPVNFVQDNQSKSKRGVIRGLHYQLTPKAQGKLVRVLKGEIFDVAVDIRKSSPTFGQWVGVNLSSDNKKQLWIPEGFAHGFLTVSKTAEVLYKVTEYYDKDTERSIHWADKEIGIDWTINLSPCVSEKDDKAPVLKKAEIFDDL